MNAVIRTGGKQYRVAEGDIIYVEKLPDEIGSEVEFEVLMIADGDNVKIGAPLVEGATVKGKLVDNVKGKKITVFKFKAKKNYRKKQGHRQPYSKVEIVSIAG
ncbi:MAG: 50S ribosomal protein L21 [Christensenellales bacterium]|jgi:large subunit ribosomal protein L21